MTLITNCQWFLVNGAYTVEPPECSLQSSESFQVVNTTRCLEGWNSAHFPILYKWNILPKFKMHRHINNSKCSHFQYFTFRNKRWKTYSLTICFFVLFFTRIQQSSTIKRLKLFLILSFHFLEHLQKFRKQF